jgi:hypothetical protein
MNVPRHCRFARAYGDSQNVLALPRIALRPARRQAFFFAAATIVFNRSVQAGFESMDFANGGFAVAAATGCAVSGLLSPAAAELGLSGLSPMPGWGFPLLAWGFVSSSLTPWFAPPGGVVAFAPTWVPAASTHCTISETRRLDGSSGFDGSRSFWSA